MKKITMFFVVLLFASMSFTSNGLAASIFKDVFAKDWYYDDVSWAVNQGLVKGYSDETFRPRNLFSESQFAVVLTRYLNKGLTDGVLPQHQTEVQYAYLKDNNILLPGHSTNSKVQKPTSRIVMARAIYAATGHVGSDKEVIDWMYGNQLTTGKGISKDKYIDFGSNDHLSRAHGAAFFKRAHDRNLIKKTSHEEQRIQEIQKKWNVLKPRYNGPMHSEQPYALDRYSVGKVNPQYLKEALNLTNFVRFLSYLPSDIRLNAQFNKEAQAASLVNAANSQLTHTPKKPWKMDEDLFQLGYKGANTSNLGMGHTDFNMSIQRYMADADGQNRIHVGHRRWILSPRLQEVGFGFVYDINGHPYTAMKVIAPNMWDNPSAPYDYIVWPSKTAFPTSFFGTTDPWSISLNDERYDSSKVANLTVELTRKKDGKTWIFSKNNSSDGYFNLSTESYGNTPYTLIFQPKNVGEYKKGDTYEVRVSGIYLLTGNVTSISYETTFFDLVE